MTVGTIGAAARLLSAPPGPAGTQVRPRRPMRGGSRSAWPCRCRQGHAAPLCVPRSFLDRPPCVPRCAGAHCTHCTRAAWHAMATPAQNAISREKRGWLAKGRGRRYHATRAVQSDVRRLWFHRVPFTSASRQLYKTHLDGSSDRSCGQRADRRGSSAVQEIVGAKRPYLRLETPRSVSQAHPGAAAEGVPEAIQGTQGNPASSDGWRTTGCVCGRDSQGVLEEDRETMRSLFSGWECAGGRVARPARAW